MQSKLVINHIINWIKDYAINSKKKSLIIGISGGIDSALTSTLCAETQLDTLLISMPIHQSQEEITRTQKHIDWLKQKYPNVKSDNIDLTNLFDLFKNTMPNSFNNELGFANTKARLRMTTLYQISTAKNGLVVGTGNKIEDFCIGFFTKYGDGGVDISPIGDLTKSEVYLLAKSFNIINEILSAEPTDGLWQDNRTDVDQIGATYKEIEWVMNNLNTEKSMLNNSELNLVKLYQSHHKKNQHKMLPIPVCKIPKN